MHLLHLYFLTNRNVSQWSFLRKFSMTKLTFYLLYLKRLLKTAQFLSNSDSILILKILKILRHKFSSHIFTIFCRISDSWQSRWWLFGIFLELEIYFSSWFNFVQILRICFLIWLKIAFIWVFSNHHERESSPAIFTLFVFLRRLERSWWKYLWLFNLVEVFLKSCLYVWSLCLSKGWFGHGVVGFA